MIMTRLSFLFGATLLASFQESQEGIQRLIEQLGSEEISVREEAELKLKAIGENAEPGLKKAAEGKDPELSARALRLLRRIQIIRRLTPTFIQVRPEVIDRLASGDDLAWTTVLLEVQSSDPSGRPRYLKLRRLDLEPLLAEAFKGANSSKLKSDLCSFCLDWRIRAAIPQIGKLLADRDVEVRQSAAYVLGQFEAVEFTANIAGLLKDPAPAMRAQAATSLAALGARAHLPDIVALIAWPGTHRRGVLRAIAALGATEHTKQVLACLEDNSCRDTAIETLGQLRARDYSDRVAPLLRDPSTEMRSIAAEALGRMGSRDHADAVIPIMEDADWNCGIRGVLAISAIGSTRHVPKLIPLLRDSRYPVRIYAVRAVMKLGGPEYIPELAALIRDPERGPRNAAMSALIQLKSKKHYGSILEVLSKETDFRRLVLDYDEIRLAADGLFSAELAPKDKEVLLDLYRRCSQSEESFSRQSASIALLRHCLLDREAQRVLVEDVLGSRGVTLIGKRLVDALAEIHEKATWEKLSRELDVSKKVETVGDLSKWFEEHGLQLKVEGPLILSTPLEMGQRTSLRNAIDAGAWRTRVLFPEGTSVRVMRWDAALELWSERLNTR